MKITFTSEIDRSSTESGIGLIATVLIISVFTSLILIMARYNWANSNMNALEAVNKKVYYIAESGIEYALKRSLNNKNWNWSQNGSFGGGNVSISVLPLAGDTVLIRSISEMDIAAKSHSLLLDVINLMDYSVYVSGSLNGSLGYDSITRLRFDAPVLPKMNLDSLKQVAQSQGAYSAHNLTIDKKTSAFEFWSNPGDHSQNANVVYVEGDLTLKDAKGRIGGIFVVMGKLKLEGYDDFNGIIYMADSSSEESVECKAKKTNRTLYGGIIGNTAISSESTKSGPELTVYYDSIFLEKFYTYSLQTDPVIVDKISWVSNY